MCVRLSVQASVLDQLSFMTKVLRDRGEEETVPGEAGAAAQSAWLHVMIARVNDLREALVAPYVQAYVASYRARMCPGGTRGRVVVGMWR